MSNDTSARGAADFFSPEVFQIVLHNPATAHQLLKFSQARLCGENMEFLERVRILACLLDEESADDGLRRNRWIATIPSWTN
jgi:hypothetical protein